MTAILLWLDTILSVETEAQMSIVDCTVAMRAWAVDHAGDMRGFSYGVAPVTIAPPWWMNKKTPFKARALPGCCLWRIPAADPITSAIAADDPYQRLTDKRVMDVSEVWLPGGKPPGWFVVFTTSRLKYVVLADQTTQGGE